MRCVFRVLALVLSASFASSAEAADDARAVFEEGVKAAARGDAAAACRLFEQSYAMVPSLGSQLNVAGCFEERGQVVAAYNAFAGALARAEREGKPDRAATARQRLAAIEAKVGRIFLRTSEPLPDRASPWLDGQETPELLERPVAVAPGARTIEIRNADVIVWSANRSIAPGNLEELTVPSLAKTPGTDKAASPPPVRDLRRPAAFATIGLGAVALGVCTVTGILALGKKSEADDVFGAGRIDEANSIVDDAQPLATLSTVTGIAGVLLVAGGVTLLLTGKPPRQAASTPHLGVVRGVRGAAFGGTF